MLHALRPAPGGCDQQPAGALSRHLTSGADHRPRHMRGSSRRAHTASRPMAGRFPGPPPRSCQPARPAQRCSPRTASGPTTPWQWCPPASSTAPRPDPGPAPVPPSLLPDPNLLKSFDLVHPSPASSLGFPDFCGPVSSAGTPSPLHSLSHAWDLLDQPVLDVLDAANVPEVPELPAFFHPVGSPVPSRLQAPSTTTRQVPFHSALTQQHQQQSVLRAAPYLPRHSQGCAWLQPAFPAPAAPGPGSCCCCWGRSAQHVNPRPLRPGLQEQRRCGCCCLCWQLARAGSVLPRLLSWHYLLHHTHQHWARAANTDESVGLLKVHILFQSVPACPVDTAASYKGARQSSCLSSHLSSQRGRVGPP